MACRHQDIRLFDGLRCCLACGEAVFDTNEAETLPKDQDVSNVPYQYSGLNYRLGQEIRICVLLPGDPSDDLRCELIHVNLNDDPVYDAVSYTWATQNGDTQLSCSINCIGRGFIRITANCNAVLRRLRTNGTRKQLWLDAICIDQTQVAERNHQVAMMDQVYSGARCVHICMFDTVPSSYDGYEQLFRWLRKDPMTLTPERHVLCRLLDLRYFSRVWVSLLGGLIM